VKMKESAFYKDQPKQPPKQLHVLLSDEDHAKLVALSKAMEAGASEVIRQLIRAARVKG
jgi:hypothetical protein